MLDTASWSAGLALDDGAVCLHVLDETVTPDSPPNVGVVSANKGITVFPCKETSAVHPRVREPVEGIGEIANKVGGCDNVVVFAKYVLANRAA